MIIGSLAAFALWAQPAVHMAEQVDVAHNALVEGRNEEVIKRFDADAALQADDPAVLINLGIALAREGKEEEARLMFAAAITSEKRSDLKTVDGKWSDSTYLARKAMRMLEDGNFAREHFASR